jgi:hypothetical protein
MKKICTILVAIFVMATTVFSQSSPSTYTAISTRQTVKDKNETSSRQVEDKVFFFFNQKDKKFSVSSSKYGIDKQFIVYWDGTRDNHLIITTEYSDYNVYFEYGKIVQIVEYPLAGMLQCRIYFID